MGKISRPNRYLFFFSLISVMLFLLPFASPASSISLVEIGSAQTLAERVYVPVVLKQGS